MGACGMFALFINDQTFSLLHMLNVLSYFIMKRNRSKVDI